MTQLILFDVFNGLIVGAFYALMALGLSLEQVVPMVTSHAARMIGMQDQ